MHASFIDGATSAGGAFKRFKHNDLQHLESLLSKTDANKPILVATEGVFSMDGDTPEMPEIAKLVTAHNAWLMVDDAHAIGGLGETGVGSAEHFTLGQDNLQVVMGTFGKSLGTSGAFIAGSQMLIDYLVNFARDYVYSTAMPPAQAYATQKAWQIMQSGELTRALQKNIDYFRGAANHHAIPLLTSTSAIQLVPIGDPNLTVEIGDRLKKLGIWVGAMRSPTVPKGTDRLRITIRATHTQQDIDATVDALSLTLKQYHRESVIGINS
jgi:8-amino-7-oxononanoate synthase